VNISSTSVRASIAAFFCAVLAGCASLEAPSDRYEGRFAVTALQDGKPASANGTFHLSRTTSEFSLRLTSTFGVRIAEVTYDGTSAVITALNADPVSDADPQTALERATGLRIPVQKILAWLDGAPAEPRTEVIPVREDTVGFVEDGWVVTIRNPGEIPRLITASYPEENLRVKLVLSEKETRP